MHLRYIVVVVVYKYIVVVYMIYSCLMLYMKYVRCTIISLTDVCYTVGSDRAVSTAGVDISGGLADR